MALRLALCVAFSTCVANDTFDSTRENATHDYDTYDYDTATHAEYRGNDTHTPFHLFTYDNAEYQAAYDVEYNHHIPADDFEGHKATIYGATHGHEIPLIRETYQAEYQAAYDAEYNYQAEYQAAYDAEYNYENYENHARGAYAATRTQLIHMHAVVVSIDAHSVERVARQCAAYHVVGLMFFILVALCFRARCVRRVCDMPALAVVIKPRYEAKRDAGLVGRDCERAEALGVLKC